MEGTPDFWWIATLDDGTTAVEHRGEYQIVPGERTPWVRFCVFAANGNRRLTSLRLWFRGRTIHMPREKFNRFGLPSLPPLYYSLQYHLEADDMFSGSPNEERFVDLAAHFETFIVHYIQDVTEGSNSWVVVTDTHKRLATSPMID